MLSSRTLLLNCLAVLMSLCLILNGSLLLQEHSPSESTLVCALDFEEDANNLLDKDDPEQLSTHPTKTRPFLTLPNRQAATLLRSRADPPDHPPPELA